MQVRIDRRSVGARLVLSAQRLRTLTARACAIAGPRLRTVELSVVFVSVRHSRRLNRQFRKRTAVADVLSFSLGRVPGRPQSLLGEIFLCPDAIRKRCEESGRTLSQETAALFVHGVLHLLGFDHHAPLAYTRMRRLEGIILGTTPQF